MTMPNDTIPENMLPLSQEEMDELADFLASDEISDETMMLDTLDGYLTAIAVGPVNLEFGQWFPGIWGTSQDDLANFRTKQEAQRIIDLILHQMNEIIFDLEEETEFAAEVYAPIFDIRSIDGQEYDDAEMWAFGFMCGMALCQRDWQPFFNNHNGNEILRPIYLLGSDDLTPEDESFIETVEQRHEIAQRIRSSVMEIYRFWLPYREALFERAVATAIEREHPEISRNDPCPCSSGLKFMKCCGMAGTLH